MSSLAEVSLEDEIRAQIALEKAKEIEGRPAAMDTVSLEDQLEKELLLNKAVTVPGSQGLGAPFGGDFLGGTVDSDRYLYPFNQV